MEEYADPAAVKWNLVDVPYACPGGTTYHPLIFRGVLQSLLTKTGKTKFDYALLVELQNRGIVSIETVKFYIMANGVTPESHWSRTELFRQFVECVSKSFDTLPQAKSCIPETGDNAEDLNSEPKGLMI